MRKKKKLSLIICIIMFLFFYNWRETVDREFLALESCPACYGENQCDKILKADNFVFTSPTKWKLFNMILNIKNIYYGQTKARSYVLKKLAYNSELLKFDEDLCLLSGLSSSCNVSKAISSIIDGNKDVVSTVMKYYGTLFKNNDAIKCNHSEILRFLYNNFIKFDVSDQNMHHFITLMSLNPEPVIMQAFHDIFPVPLFLGSCGRVVVEEYAGQTLSKFYDESWLTRARLSVQLLKMAISMSENEIRMYLTDPSSDNFAVNSHGLLKLIDVENVVLVDSRKDGLDTQPYFNDGFGCKSCFSFDYEELCSHSWSDHNYFAVCKGLLSSIPFSSSLPSGLLHSIPSNVETKLNLSSTIEECALPLTRKDRRFIVKELLHQLQLSIQLVSDYSTTSSELKK